MTFRSWRTHFEHNALRPLPDVPPTVDEIPTAWRRPLADCLAKLQLGETGEGRIAHEIESVTFSGIDDDYRRALRLFVAEEGRHARILGRLLRGLDARPLAKHFSAAWFRIGRNLFGVRWKLWVLDTAEIVSTVLYRELASALPDGPTRAALREIAEDEGQHFAFHGVLFARWVRETPMLATPLQLGWWACGLGAASVVVASHGASLAALGVPRRVLFRRMLDQVALGARTLGGAR